MVPSDLIDRAVFYTKGYPVDIHDPDVTYSGGYHVKDYEYAIRMAQEVAKLISKDLALAKCATMRILQQDIKYPFPFMETLAEHLEAPDKLFFSLVDSLDQTSHSINRQALSGFICGMARNNPNLFQPCIQRVLQSSALRSTAIHLMGAVTLRAEDLQIVFDLLDSGDITAYECRSLSYGRRLEHFSEEEIVTFVDKLEQYGSEGISASIDTLKMYLHGKRIERSTIEEHIKAVLTNKDLFTQCKSAENYDISSLFMHVHSSGYLDEIFSKKLLQLFLYTDDNIPRIYDKLSKAKYDILQILIEKYPSLVWGEVAAAFADAKNRSWLKRFFAPNEDYVSGTKKSILSLLPEELYLSWADEADTEERLQFILSWIPHTITEGSNLSWHPLVQKIAGNTKITKSALNALCFRIGPRGWVGSIVPYLEQYIPLFKEWSSHSNPVVSSWASDMATKLRKDIAAWKKRDEEDQLR